MCFGRSSVFLVPGLATIALEACDNRARRRSRSRRRTHLERRISNHARYGPGRPADVQYLFIGDVLGRAAEHKPRHAKTYRRFAVECERLQNECVDALKEFIDDLSTLDRQCSIGETFQKSWIRLGDQQRDITIKGP